MHFSRFFLGCLLTPCHLTLSRGSWGLGLMFTQAPPGTEHTFESSFFQLYRQRQGEHSHRTQPSSVKQFQLLLLMNFFGGEKKKSIGLFFRCGCIHRAVSRLWFLLIQFKSGEGLKHQLFWNLANYNTILNSSQLWQEEFRSVVLMVDRARCFQFSPDFWCT